MAPSAPSRRAYSAAANRLPTLPRLPVPDLHQTLSKYLRSLVPVLQEDEARGGAPWRSALQERQRWAVEFEGGLGARCQERLHGKFCEKKKALDRSSPRNWLDDNIWLKKAYHEWRLPLLIHSNWWLAFFNDDRIPEHALRQPPSSESAQITPWQVRRAAWLTFRHLEFRDGLARRIYPNTSRTGLWFQEAVAKIFNTCRIPQPHCDSLSPQPPSHVPNARKILVMVNDWTYAAEVYDENRRPLPVHDIEQRLRSVVHDVTQRIQAGESAVPVGILSADHRDNWTENLRYLLSLSPTNLKTLQVIQQSILAVCLDSHTLGLHPHTHSQTLRSAPAVNSPAEIDCHLHNIRSSINARNRWFDKGYTIIIETNSRAGAMGEHSPCDALVPSIVADYAVTQSIVPEMFSLSEPPSFPSDRDLNVTGWERLDWVTDAHIEAECVAAESRAQSLIADSDDSVLWFSDYGADWIKSIAGLSPDAYVQMALQLAWYRSRGGFTATYETALTRAFDKARTETIRTLSEDSRAWVLSMTDATATVATRLALLRRAIKTHNSLTREAATGRGIDRHLLGLRLMMRPDAGERAALFDDPLFERSQEWKLSTSALSAGPLFRGTGFGAPYHDGYGINYLCGPDLIKFGIESKFSCAETSTRTFQNAIASALREMRQLCSPEPIRRDAPAVARL
ncbi:acyltransferase ChoActase/COT/CPT [Russula earlei]|uniref:Acyltransferase ChoActase/COT/CPT n=1 Tax=Russula earlei TaxID=71964 RepID=A0ACC0UK08_9AGAM|nr:acyltransferase ChoActase/COT/CPT [Russula earlei]